MNKHYAASLADFNKIDLIRLIDYLAAVDFFGPPSKLYVATRACERSVSGAGAGGRRNGNGAVSGQNPPLKIRSTVKVKSSKLILKVITKLSV